MKRYTEEYIGVLLGKFMDGTSSIEEEDILGEYFRTQKTKTEWEEYRRMFAYFDSGMELPLPAEQLQNTTRQTPQDARRHKGSVVLLAAAAAVAVLCIMLFTLLPTGGHESQTAQVSKRPAADFAETPKGYTIPATADMKDTVEVSPLPFHTVKQQATRTVTNRKKTAAKASKSYAAAKGNADNIPPEAMEELQMAETELERIQNEIAEYNGEALMAQAALYDVTEEVTEEIHGSGDAQDNTAPGIRFIRTMTMQ